MIKYIHIVLPILIFAVAVPFGFGESFNGRPTETEIDELVMSGTESGHGVYERCYATQYSPNPDYHISPPSFIGTNGWYLSTSVMQALDDKAKALVQYYVDSATWAPDMGSFGSPLTITGLWAKLDIGDGVNQFTGTPAIGTNSPTYGDYPWRMYPVSLEERYEVLNALRWTVDNTRQVTNQSWYGLVSDYYGGTEDPWTFKYIHKITGAKLITYDHSWEPIALGKKSEWVDYYQPTLGQYGMESNYFWVNTNYDLVGGFSTDGTYQVAFPLTWTQVSEDLIAGAFWGFGDGWSGDWPPYGDLTGYLGGDQIHSRFQEYETRLTNSLPLEGYGSTVQVKPGTYSWAQKVPNVIGWWSDGHWILQGYWGWIYCYYTGKATWMWYSPISNAVPNTLIGVFAVGTFQTPNPLPPINPVGITEVYSGSSNSWDSWTYPREWQIDKESPWSELSGLASTNYVKLEVSTEGDWLYMAFGGPDEVTGALTDMPPHPAAPQDSGNEGYWNSATFWDNENSVGTAKGILVNDAYIVRDWDFQYCTDE